MDTSTIQLASAPQWWQMLASTTEESPEECDRILAHLRAALRAGAVPDPAATWHGLGLLSALFIAQQDLPNTLAIGHARDDNTPARQAIATALITAAHDPAVGLAAVQACVDPAICAWNADVTDLNHALASPIACAVSANDPHLLRLFADAARSRGASVPIDLGFACSGGDTWLHDAMRRQRPAMAEALLDLGWNPMARNDLGETAFHLAWDAGSLRMLCRHAPLPSRLAPSLLGYWIDLPEGAGLMEAVAHRRAFRHGAALRAAWRGEGVTADPSALAATLRLPGSSANLSLRALALLEMLLDHRGTRPTPSTPAQALLQAAAEDIRRLAATPPSWSPLERDLAIRAARRNPSVLVIPPASACTEGPPALPPAELAAVLFHAITRRAVFPPTHSPGQGVGLTLWPGELTDIFAPKEIWPATLAIATWLLPDKPPHRNTSVSAGNLAGSLCTALLPAPPAASHASPRDVDKVLHLLALSRNVALVTDLGPTLLAAAAKWNHADWLQNPGLAWDAADTASLLPPAYRMDVENPDANMRHLPPLAALCSALRAVRAQCRIASRLSASAPPRTPRLRA